MPIGEIRMFAGNFAPEGWAFCEGQSLEWEPQVAERIGKTWGGHVPDLRDRAPMHMGRDMKLGDTRVVRVAPATEWQSTAASLAVHFIIQLRNVDNMFEGEAYIGEIRMFAGNRGSRGWLPCDGRQMRIIENTALFTILGDTYGEERSREVFCLPNLNGRVPVHPRDRSGLGKKIDVRGIDPAAKASTHLPLRFWIAAEGVYPRRP